MSPSLKESRAICDIAELLYDFLPGSGNARWSGHVTFRSVADKIGVGEFWQAGSKTPMITALLEQTLDRRRDRFEPLILEIVRAGITYRQKQARPITPAEIKKLNGLILEVGFKFPDLWDSEFLQSLEIEGSRRAAAHVETAINEQKVKASALNVRATELEQIKLEFYSLQSMTPQQAGLVFEKTLNRLFALHGLAPREPFCVVGEQIDGSFDLDHETYLVEAKWTKEPLPEAELLVFRGKIEGKSAYTRGVFISLNGITKPAEEAITRGKQPTFFVVNGYDLAMILSDDISLDAFLRQRRRLLAEEGAIAVPYLELWQGTRRSRESR